ncbi:hypothetical protein IB221_05990 [Pantoea sp. PNT01]|uniref:hypothetical protein n=1 Tax=unclassified Pantoea TaxID=2630326 RepID=UPI000CF51670|nr:MULTISPECIES: hypothetical protein [unclassified Pantoea]MBD9551812.1 hypothetical protein [Pantoea sp. PNT01]MCD2355272.1 hypothetical protein [Pantoea sp. MHSD4]PQL29508.1 hypothetical protein C5L22_02325 [Pantoea ananatis]
MELENIKNKKYSLGIILFLIMAFLIIMIRPDVITNAQPWAEDGRLWLHNAYNNDIIITFIMSENGFFQTIYRLTYSIFLLFGLSKAALVANIIGILIRDYSITLILSSCIRLAPLVYRATVAIYVLLIPNIAEGFPDITNRKCQWKKYGLLLGISS